MATNEQNKILGEDVIDEFEKTLSEDSVLKWIARSNNEWGDQGAESRIVSLSIDGLTIQARCDDEGPWLDFRRTEEVT